jgi:hypothetical protein
MAILKGYADDSRPGDRIWVVAGYLGNDVKWQVFESEWPILLAKHDIPYFHMKELGRQGGAYAKWHPLKDHYVEIAAFFDDMTALIGRLRLNGFFSIVRISDLERFNAETGLTIEAYPLAAYGCALMIAGEYRNLTSEVFFDRVEKAHSKLGRATEYAESDHHSDVVFGNVGLFPLQRGLTFRQLAPLQVADFFAWELQRNHLNADEWHASPGRPLDDDKRWQDFQNWELRKYGIRFFEIAAYTALPRAHFLGELRLSRKACPIAPSVF